jgi:hypothetical protein
VSHRFRRLLLGNAGAVTPAPAPEPSRRTAEAVTVPFGKLTRLGMGGVSYANIPGLLQDHSVAVQSWSTAPPHTGDTNDFALNLDGGATTPVPASNGSATDDTYSWEVTVIFADGVEETFTLTYNTAGKTTHYTLSNRDNLTTFFNNLAGSNAARNGILGGKTVEYAVGTVQTGVVGIDFWEPTSGTGGPSARVTITSSDLNRRAVFSHFRILSCKRVDLVGFDTSGVASTAPQAFGRIVLARNDTGPITADCTITNISQNVDKAVVQAATANLNGHTTIAINGASNITIDSCNVRGVMNFLSADPDEPHENILVKNCLVRDIHSNGLIFGTYDVYPANHPLGAGNPNPNAGLWSLTVEDSAFIALHRIPNSLDHGDGGQIQQQTVGGRFTVRRCIVHEWDGDAAAQAWWYGSSARRSTLTGR